MYCSLHHKVDRESPQVLNASVYSISPLVYWLSMSCSLLPHCFCTWSVLTGECFILGVVVSVVFVLGVWPLLVLKVWHGALFW
jgi:uncharacterized membrane protein